MVCPPVTVAAFAAPPAVQARQRLLHRQNSCSQFPAPWSRRHKQRHSQPRDHHLHPHRFLRRSCLSPPVILAFSPTQESGKRNASSQSSAIITKASSCLHDGRGQNGSHGCPLPTKLSERIIRMTTIRRAATSQSKLSLSDWLGAYLPR